MPTLEQKQVRMPSLESLINRIQVHRVYQSWIEIDDLDTDEFPDERLYQSVWSTVEQASTPQEARRLYIDQLTEWHKRVTEWLRNGA
jgi:hypothetical protein